MKPQVVSRCFAHEVFIREGCFITEVWNSPHDPTLSVARARLTPHSETRWHYLDVDERYLITQGVGNMEVQGLAPSNVANGDVVCGTSRTPPANPQYRGRRLNLLLSLHTTFCPRRVSRTG